VPKAVRISERISELRYPVWIMSGVAFVVLASWIVNSAMAEFGHPLVYPSWLFDNRNYIEMFLAAGIVLVMTLYRGPEKGGLAGSFEYNVRAVLHAMALFIVGAVVVWKLFGWMAVGAVASGDIPRSVLGGSFTNIDPTNYQYVLWSAHAATEEIFVVGFLFFLFDRVPWRIKNVPFALTGWATAVSILIRVSYHTYHEIYMIPIALVGWAMVRMYRATGSLIPLMITHTYWDLLVHYVGDESSQLIGAGVFAALMFVLTKGPNNPFSILGFGKTRYWADWRAPHWVI
jgi:hypothetical protein